MMRFVMMLLSQQRAVDNARAAATALSARGVERREVQLFLDELATSLETPATTAREVLPG